MDFLALASLAIVAGVLSFTAPCTLPLLPGYISYVSGVSGVAGDSDASGTSSAVRTDTALPAHVRRRVMLGAVLFVAGFSAVFTALGATASALGFLLSNNLRTINLIGGVLIVLMGLNVMGLLRIPALRRHLAFDPARIARGPAGAFPLGAAFAFGWTPCVGPVLASILATAASTATASRGALLLLAYSLGLGVPFLLLALLLARGTVSLQWLRRHGRRIEIVSGIILVVMGVAIMTGGWTALMSRVLAFYARLGWPPI